MSLLSSIRSLLSELSRFGFPLLRKSKGYTLDSGLTPTRSEKKKKKIPPTAPISPQNHCTGLSVPFQLNSKPNSSPQRTLQSSESKRASHPDSEIMLPGPAMDAFEARAECRADKLTLTRGREHSTEQWSKVPGSLRTVRSLPLVRVTLSARHSARASKVSIAVPRNPTRWLCNSRCRR